MLKNLLQILRRTLLCRSLKYQVSKIKFSIIINWIIIIGHCFAERKKDLCNTGGRLIIHKFNVSDVRDALEEAYDNNLKNDFPEDFNIQKSVSNNQKEVKQKKTLNYKKVKDQKLLKKDQVFLFSQFFKQ